MNRRIAHFSCGAASAVATKLSAPDEIWYADTGAEDEDNHRFLKDCEVWFGKKVTVLRSEKYKDTWDVWESKKYIAGVKGAPCTGELKIKPREANQLPGDIHIFGYTADKHDMNRAQAIKERNPQLLIETPLIDRFIKKEACLSILKTAGIAPPRTYALGFHYANCIPCCKSQSPAYWALIRKHFPDKFDRMAELSRRLGATLITIRGERAYIDEIPEDQDVSSPISPACDLLCYMAEEELFGKDR